MAKSKHPIKVFISHSSKDAEIAESLIRYLMSEFDLVEDDIRCTSVPGFEIPAGEFIVERLREDVDKGLCFIALLTDFGLDSLWVSYELGAAWVKKKETMPILGPDIEDDDNRLGINKQIKYIKISSPNFKKSFAQYIKQASGTLNMPIKKTDLSKRKLREFIDKFRNFGGSKANLSKTSVKILSLKSGQKLKAKNNAVKFTVKNLPQDGYLWLGVLIDKVFYPKESLNKLIVNGRGSASLNEGGDGKEKIEVCIIGVGRAGNNKLEVEYKKEEKEQRWPGIKLDEIYGVEKLASVDNLSI